MPKISVIIPVYNVESYLKQCLESVINQSLKDIEIICINDCSTDGSLDILEKYVSKENRIKLINLPQNQGVSIARNIGLDNANGEYIAFLDPDDWWEPELAELSLNKIKESDADILVFGSNFCDKDKITTNEEHLTYLYEVSKQNYIKTYKSYIVNYTWDKLYKTEFLRNHNIKFIEGLSQAEDVMFSLECLSYNPQIVSIPRCFYNYRINRLGSAMTDYSNLVTNQIKAFKTMLDCNFYLTSYNQYKQFCINTLLGGIVYFYVLSSQKKFCLEDFLKLRKLVSYMKLNIPAELLTNNTQYTVLSNLTSANLKNGISCLKTKVK